MHADRTLLACRAVTARVVERHFGGAASAHAHARAHAGVERTRRLSH